jgi:hypothetical protein
MRIGFLQRFSCLIGNLLNAGQYADGKVIQFAIKLLLACCAASQMLSATGRMMASINTPVTRLTRCRVVMSISLFY